VALAAVLLYLALRHVDWAAFAAILRTARYALLIPAFLWGSLTDLVRSVRWRILLVGEKPVGVGPVFWANMAGYLGNNLLPARAGEFIRALYLGREAGMSATFVYATGLAEQIVDATALIILGVISLSAVGLANPQLQTGLRVMAVAVGVALLLLILAPRFSSQLDSLVTRLPRLGEQRKAGISAFLHNFLRGLGSLLHVRPALLFALFTVLVWTMDALSLMLLGRALGLGLSLFQAWLLIAALGLSSGILATPGYVGIYQFVAVAVMTPLGYSAASAVALIVLAQVTIYLIVLFWGLLALARIPRKLGNTPPAQQTD
jgi:uncharacterized protein (TIRG00374 family)